jgi:hypothetical protein
LPSFLSALDEFRDSPAQVMSVGGVNVHPGLLHTVGSPGDLSDDGCSILASGRQRHWAAVQFITVVVSTALDPFLIPWFQARNGNGGLGVCVASLVSEMFMVGAGVRLAVDGIFDRAFALSLVRGLVAGGAMTVVALLLSGLTPFLAAPLALAAYLGCLWGIGGLGQEQIGIVREAFARRTRRA